MGKRNVTKSEFSNIKRKLRFNNNYQAAVVIFERSLATITRIDQAKNYDEFKRLVRAEHPPLRETTIGKQFARLLARAKTKGLLDDDDIKWIKTGIRNDK